MTKLDMNYIKHNLNQGKSIVISFSNWNSFKTNFVGYKHKKCQYGYKVKLIKL